MTDTSENNSCNTPLPAELKEHYDTRFRQLGTGAFSNVILAEHKATGEQVAIKVMEKSMLEEKNDLHRAYVEIDALKSIQHQNICQLYQVLETEERIYLVLEYCHGGELFDYIVSKKRLEEEEATVLFRQMVAALMYIHSKGLAHRDLKPENMLLDDQKGIKIIDFGLSVMPAQGLDFPLSTRVGSPAYAAPEVISGAEYYGNETDVWSLGVVLYAVLCGFLPFDDDDTGALFNKIRRGEFIVPGWLSREASSLLRGMLETKPRKRLTTAHLLCHEFVMKSFDEPIIWKSTIEIEEPDEDIITEVSACHDLSIDEVRNCINERTYDEVMAHYLLLLRQRRLRQKREGQPQKPTKKRIREADRNANYTQTVMDRRRFSMDQAPKAKMRAQSVPDAMDVQNDKLRFKEKLNGVSRRDKRRSNFHRFDGKTISEGETLDTCSTETALPEDLPWDTNIHTNPRDRKRAMSWQDNRSISSRLSELTDRFTTMFRQRDQPRKVKAVYHVENTSTRPASDVQLELERVLQSLAEKGIIVEYNCPERYLFRCKANDGRGKKLIFELEICTVPYVENVVGIRRKRLKGEVWLYKDVVERILAMAKL